MSVKKVALFFSVVGVIAAQVLGSSPFSGPIGWADVAGDAGTGTMIQTTTGGTGGKIVTVTTVDELNEQISLRKRDTTPIIIRIQGTLFQDKPEMIATNDCRNMTIEGADKDAKIKGFGLYLRKSSNIIFRNLTFENCPDDAINIDGAHTPTNHHVWVDHCNFSDFPMGTAPDLAAATSDSTHDGLIDIKNGSCYITISFCRFDNHSKGLLFGHECDNAVDANIKVTVHHNWFGMIAQRATRNRSGKVHLFNNYYEGTGTVLFPKLEKDKTYHHGYAIASVCGANVVVESNYFSNVIWATLVSRNSENSAEWKQIYGMVGTLPHWCPTSDEDAGYLSYRGENIQNPASGTELTVLGPGGISQNWKIFPLDVSNPDPQKWNPWIDYGYTQDKINSVLHNAADIPTIVKSMILNGDINTATRQTFQQTNSNLKINACSKYYDLHGRQINFKIDKNTNLPSLYIRSSAQGVQSVIINGQQ